MTVDVVQPCAASDQVQRMDSHESGRDRSSGISTALGAIFNDDHVTESALMIHRRAAAMSTEERFAFLRHWVLPNETHSTIRLQAGFTTTYPAPPVDDGPVRSGRRIGAGGQIVCPALDLVDTAMSLGCIAALEQETQSIRPADRITARNRIALLAVIEMKRGDVDTTLARCHEMIQLNGTDLPFDSASRASEFIVFLRGIAFPEVRDALLDYANSVRNGFRNAAIWARTSSEIHNVGSHGDDMLYFSVPLRGDFAVESDVTTVGWMETEFVVGGHWVSPLLFHRRDYDVGDLRGFAASTAFTPPLASIREWMHYRTNVKSNAATTSINGRLLHTEKLRADHDPWLALRSRYVTDGGARNIRVTGDPVIPDTIDLLAGPALESWIPGFDRGIPWNYLPWRKSGNELHGEQRTWLPDGCFCETAIYYHRPMLDDGTIDYELFYDRGRSMAHPAIDR